MSKYNKFNDFMIAVIEESDTKCNRRYSISLNSLYKVTHANVIKMIIALISEGWWIFLAVVAILVLGKFAFIATLIAFVVTPVGLIVVAALTVFGGKAAIEILYKNRLLPMAIRETGNKYESDFNQKKNDISSINNLIDQASDYLIDKAKYI